MKIKAIGFVGIPVTDLERAREFYEGVLGLKVSDEMMGGKWIEYTVATTRSRSRTLAMSGRHLIRERARRLRLKISTKRFAD